MIGTTSSPTLRIAAAAARRTSSTGDASRSIALLTTFFALPMCVSASRACRCNTGTPLSMSETNPSIASGFLTRSSSSTMAAAMRFSTEASLSIRMILSMSFMTFSVFPSFSTSRSSAAVTGTTEMRAFFTRAICFSFALSLMAASDTGMASGFTGSTSTVTQSSPLGAVASA